MKELLMLVVAIFATGFIAVSSFFAIRFVQARTPISNTTSELKIDERELWRVVNEWRVKNNFPEYIKSPLLSDIAYSRALEQPRDHENFFKKYGGENFQFEMLENLSIDIMSPNGILDAWLNSPPHKATLEASYTHSAIRCYRTSCIQIFSSFQQ